MGTTSTIQLNTINNRYSGLARSNCCLSCGGAASHADVRPGEVCVDLGSGRGSDVLRMADSAGPDGFAYGIDVSDGMLEKASSTAKRLGATNVRFIKSDLEDIRLDDGIADVVISNCAINHAADKRRVWKEIYRILKTGGRFVVSDIYSTREVPEKHRSDPRAVAECWAGAVTRDEYLETVAEAGFADVRIIEESRPYPKGEIEVSSWTITARK
jgi:ubiquinone/menaquinone biosynthesis C-methylase UbiE